MGRAVERPRWGPDSLDDLRGAFTDLLSREFDWSSGHAATLLNGCVFAPSLLTFWFVNGLLDFSTAVVIGSIASPGGLYVRLVAYVLLVPAFLVVRASYYLLHPVHRRAVLSGTCPQSRLLSLDWFSVGILATGLPLALQDLGPWVGMNLAFLLGLFVLPRLISSPSRRRATKLLGIAAGIGLFLYAQYGALAAGVFPPPESVLGPIATLSLSDRVTAGLLRATNSVLVGPPAVALVGVALNRVLTRPELTGIPYLGYTLPERDPWTVVVSSSMSGTVFYLAVSAVATGRLILVP